MGPSARLRAVQDLLEPLCEGPDFLPADQALSTYFRNRRFIGSKDRRSIRDTFYIILHCWQALSFALDRAGIKVDGRSLLLVFLKLNKVLDEALFTEGKYGLEALSEAEEKLLENLEAGQDAPAWVSGNCPQWLYQKFEDRFGKNTGAELSALNERAPVDIRINPLKAKDILEDLKGLGFEPTKYSEFGFRAGQQTPLAQHPMFLKGMIEFQDEGSQIASQIVGAKPGEQILDLCAGAGGKTLAMGADMQNKGKIYAFDIVPKKISTLMTRLKKAGVKGCQAAVIPEKGQGREQALAPLMGKMDRVLLDVPCSGTGVWRRNPDARLRLTPEKLEGYCATQAALMEEGAGLVKSGGQLTYVTCSLLSEENEARIEAFLKNNSGWKLVDYREGFTGKIPETGASIPETLLLTPGQHGTDGFFVANLMKS